MGTCWKYKGQKCKTPKCDNPASLSDLCQSCYQARSYRKRKAQGKIKPAKPKAPPQCELCSREAIQDKLCAQHYQSINNPQPTKRPTPTIAEIEPLTLPQLRLELHLAQKELTIIYNQLAIKLNQLAKIDGQLSRLTGKP